MEYEQKTLPITKLVSNSGQIAGVPKNPRTIKDARFNALKKSIEDAPEMLSLRELIVVPFGDKFVTICGNMRLSAARELGMKSMPCKVLAEDTPAAKLREYAMKDNIAFGQDDIDLILAEWDSEELAEWGFELPEEEVVEEQPEVKEDDFNHEEAEKLPPRVKRGEVWQLGKHRLMCGDSTSAEDVEKLRGGELADLLVTDPPYNVAYEGSNGLTIANDNMSDAAFRAFLTDAFKATDKALKKGAAIYIWHADSEGLNFRVAFKSAGWLLKQCLIWVKNSLVLGRQDYQWKHEPCLYGWKDGASHYFVNIRNETTTIEDEKQEFAKMKKEELVALLEELYSDRTETSIIRENKPARNAEHPTMKPIKLIARLIRNSSRIGGLVIDVFGGSGSTLIACEQLNRRCLTMELDPHYCDVIIARWETLTGKQAVKIA